MSQTEYWISVNDGTGYKVDKARFQQLRQRAGCNDCQDSWQGILPTMLPVRGWIKEGQ